ncbi:MAG: TolC family protein [Betaproteobacteria bacterium]
MRNHPLGAACAAVLIALGPACGMAAAQQPAAPAQQPAAPPAAAAIPPAPGEPAPIIQFDPQGIDLLEAVRLTLQHNTDIRLAETSVQQASGVAQEQSGTFDTSLLANGGYNYQRQELTSSAKLSESLKRSQLTHERDQQRVTLDHLQSLVADLQAVKNVPAGPAQLAALAQLDPSTAANLQMLDALAKNSGDPTLQRQLQDIRNGLITDTINNAQAGIGQAESAYNQLSSLVTTLGASPTQEFFFNGSGNVSLDRLFRNGISFSPYFNGTNNGTNYVNKPFSVDFGGKGVYTLYTFKSGFSATVPLARGLGAAAVAAPERSSLLSEQAATFDARQQASASVLQTINAYWNVRAAQENVAIAQRSVDLQGQIVQLTRGTIAAGDLPAVELARVQASEARAMAQLRDAERALHEARVALATSMGVSASDDDATLPKARDAFPAPPDAAALSDQRLAALASSAVQQRLDVVAAARRQDAANVLTRGARLNLKPRIDFTGGTWYTGLDEAVVSSALKRWVGPSYDLSLDIEKPFGNNLLRGQYVQAQAGSASSEIAAIDLQRQVRLNVVRTVRTLSEATERVKEAQAAVNFYDQTIQSEMDRYRIGEVTLIDTITTEGQQADARRALVAAQADLAQLIADLRFQTGTLVTDPAAPAPQNFVTVPQE